MDPSLQGACVNLTHSWFTLGTVEMATNRDSSLTKGIEYRDSMNVTVTAKLAFSLGKLDPI